MKGPEFPISDKTHVSSINSWMECKAGCEEASAGMGRDQTSMSHPRAVAVTLRLALLGQVRAADPPVRVRQ